MAESIDPLIIKKTQETLGSVIRKPPLTEKNLRKPPFRFLHDIITSVIKTTGFLKGLYEPEELQSENVKDKDGKIAFLQKAIDVLEIVCNQKLQVRPSKIVAGHEPQKTNEFLQLLGSSIKNKLDSKEAVQKVIGERSPKRSLPHNRERKASIDKKASSSQKLPPEKTSRSSVKGAEDSKKATASSINGIKEAAKGKDGDKIRNKGKDIKLRERGQSKDRRRLSRTEDAKESIKKGTKEKPRKEVSQKETKSVEQAATPLETSDNKENGEVEFSEEPVILSAKAEEPVNELIIGNDINNDKEAEETYVKDTTPSKEKKPEPSAQTSEIKERPVKKEKPQKPPSAHAPRPPSAKSIRTRPATPSSLMSTDLDLLNSENSTRPLTSSRPASARPPSARPAPPKIRIRHIVDNEDPSVSVRPPSAKPVENVILDTTQHSDDDDDDAFIVSDEKIKEDTEPELVINTSKPATGTPEEDQGSLVKQLLETKKDLEGGSQQPSTRKVEIDKSQMTDVARKRERESSSRELEQLRTFIQTLSRTANPLGRMLDYLQEDIDSMKAELKLWRDENHQNMIALRREQSVTESILEPLRVQLDDLELQVQDQLEANSMMKCTIFRNDERIQRMLTAINNRS